MRIVITGGPSVGKTTIVSGLERRGYAVVHEQATQIIKEGRFLPWVDRVSFQAEVLRRQVEAEQAVDESKDTVFLDRGLFDGEAYYIYDQLEIPPAFFQFDGCHYDLALLVEELPFFDVNEVRRENLEFSRRISEILEHCYASRGIKVVRVPFMPPADRIDFVIEAVVHASSRFATQISLYESLLESSPSLALSSALS